ncbi:MAG: amidohydrolase [Ruminiclostridium sp.]|nr:amidohydrolase [Ruminiclostridium sp.]
MVIDAHAHIFTEISGRVAEGSTRGIGYGRAVIGNREVQFIPPLSEKTEYTAQMLIAFMDWSGIDKAVLLQGPLYGESNIYIADALKSYPGRLMGLAYLDPWSPDARETFAMIQDTGVFCGVKLECTEAAGLFGIHKGVSLDMKEIEWIWKGLEKSRLVLTLDLGSPRDCSYQSKVIRNIALKHEELKIVIAHLGQPYPDMEKSAESYGLWQEQIDLGLLPNIWFDTACLPYYFLREEYPHPNAGKVLERVIDRIGPEKVMWGTDIPTLMLHFTYSQLLKIAKLHLQFLETEKQEMVMGGNAMKVYINADRAKVR